MFITKRSLPRRTFLKGAGGVLALPLLEAMIPASTALAQTPANAEAAVRRNLLPAWHGSGTLGNAGRTSS